MFVLLDDPIPEKENMNFYQGVFRQCQHKIVQGSFILK